MTGGGHPLDFSFHIGHIIFLPPILTGRTWFSPLSVDIFDPCPLFNPLHSTGRTCLEKISTRKRDSCIVVDNVKRNGFPIRVGYRARWSDLLRSSRARNVGKVWKNGREDAFSFHSKTKEIRRRVFFFRRRCRYNEETRCTLYATGTLTSFSQPFEKIRWTVNQIFRSIGYFSTEKTLRLQRDRVNFRTAVQMAGKCLTAKNEEKKKKKKVVNEFNFCEKFRFR